MKNNTQTGFTVFAGISIIVIIGILAALGNALWQQTRPAQPTVPSSVISATGAKTLVNTFYGKYYKATVAMIDGAAGSNPNAGESGRKLTQGLVNEYGTANLVKVYADTTAFDPILCAQNYPEAAPTATDVSVNGSQATVTMQDKYRSESGIHTYKAMVVDQNGSLKISSISCPTASSAN